MKQGVFIYQKPPSLFTGVVLGEGTFAVVAEDSIGANMEKIVGQPFDFIVCSPGLQKIVTPSKELASIVYTDIYDFHIAPVNPTIKQIKNLIG